MKAKKQWLTPSHVRKLLKRQLPMPTTGEHTPEQLLLVDVLVQAIADTRDSKCYEPDASDAARFIEDGRCETLCNLLCIPHHFVKEIYQAYQKGH